MIALGVGHHDEVSHELLDVHHDENLQLQCWSLDEQIHEEPDHIQEQHSSEWELHNQILEHHNFQQELHNWQQEHHSFQQEVHNFPLEHHNQYSLNTQFLPLFDHSDHHHHHLQADGMYVYKVLHSQILGLHNQILELHNFPQELHNFLLEPHNFLLEPHNQFHSHNLLPSHLPLPCGHLRVLGKISCTDNEKVPHRRQQVHHK